MISKHEKILNFTNNQENADKATTMFLSCQFEKRKTAIEHMRATFVYQY